MPPRTARSPNLFYKTRIPPIEGSLDQRIALEVVLATEVALYDEALKDGEDEEDGEDEKNGEEGRYEWARITEGFFEKVGDGEVEGDSAVILVLFVVVLPAVELFVVLDSIPDSIWNDEVN